MDDESDYDQDADIQDLLATNLYGHHFPRLLASS